VRWCDAASANALELNLLCTQQANQIESRFKLFQTVQNRSDLSSDLIKHHRSSE